jgi:hypothetical protein
MARKRKGREEWHKRGKEEEWHKEKRKRGIAQKRKGREKRCMQENSIHCGTL